MLKKLFAAMSISWMAQASEQTDSFSEAVYSLPEKVEMGWKDIVLAHWDMMASWQKIMVVMFVAFIVVWIVRRFFMKSGSGCCKGE